MEQEHQQFKIGGKKNKLIEDEFKFFMSEISDQKNQDMNEINPVSSSRDSQLKNSKSKKRVHQTDLLALFCKKKTARLADGTPDLSLRESAVIEFTDLRIGKINRLIGLLGIVVDKENHNINFLSKIIPHLTPYLMGSDAYFINKITKSLSLTTRLWDLSTQRHIMKCIMNDSFITTLTQYLEESASELNAQESIDNLINIIKECENGHFLESFLEKVGRKKQPRKTQKLSIEPVNRIEIQVNKPQLNVSKSDSKLLVSTSIIDSIDTVDLERPNNWEISSLDSINFIVTFWKNLSFNFCDKNIAYASCSL